MVRTAEKPSCEEAACCSVEVVKGGPGLRLVGFASTDSALKVAPSSVDLMSSACSLLEMSSFCRRLPSKPVSLASKFSLRGVPRMAAICQYSSRMKRSISSSRSQTRRSATDCTRPAERAPGSLRHSTGDRVKPTR